MAYLGPTHPPEWAAYQAAILVPLCFLSCFPLGSLFRARALFLWWGAKSGPCLEEKVEEGGK